MSEPTSPPSDTATVEALRRIKEVETEWESRLRAAREDAEQAVRRAREEADATLKAVVAETEAERVRRLEEGRAAAELETEAIRRQGAKGADALRGEKGRRPSDRAEEIVAAVLGAFSHD